MVFTWHTTNSPAETEISEPHPQFLNVKGLQWVWGSALVSGFLVTLVLPVQEVLQRQTQRIQPVRGALSGAKHLTGLSLIKCLLIQLLTQPLSSEPQLLLPGFLVIRRSCRYFHGSSGSGFVCTSFQITKENEVEGICRSNQL